jgi:hypothetical protein
MAKVLGESGRYASQAEIKKLYRDDQLWEYIVENKFANKIDKKMIESLSQAFLALATMDKEFQSSTNKKI